MKFYYFPHTPNVEIDRFSIAIYSAGWSQVGYTVKSLFKPPPPGFKPPPDIRPKKYMLHFSNVSDLESVNEESITSNGLLVLTLFRLGGMAFDARANLK